MDGKVRTPSSVSSRSLIVDCPQGFPLWLTWYVESNALLNGVDLFWQAKANIDDVNASWKGLGYYSRAKRLLEGAQKAVKDYGGQLPDNAKDMQANIPGIGRYSAGAICSIAYGERVPVVRT